jgi:hypothetical protein
LFGAVQVTVADWLFGVADTSVGGLGAVATVVVARWLKMTSTK